MTFPKPDREDHRDVRSRWVTRPVAGGQLPVLVYEPTDAARHPAIVVGAEGGGINHFIRCVAATMAHVGYVALVPDYYRGVTMTDPDDYSDIEGMVAMIAALDFRRAAHDFLEAIALARELPAADGRVAAWGYCTGGTVAMFGTCLDRDLDGAVLYYPSQPRFEALDLHHPAHVVDLVWNIACPAMLAYGDQDEVMAPDELAALGARLQAWGVEHRIVTYPGVGHAFSSPGFARYDSVVADAAWQDGLAFVASCLEAAASREGGAS